MTDVDDIIDFIKSLKKGFDKDLFQSKIDELAYAVDSTGLAYDDFHTLFKVWLNLAIPITKWVNLGSCLAPPDNVEKRSVEYAIRWILANFGNQSNFPRVGFLLDWITVAMECDSIDMTALDVGYEVFYSMLTFEDLSAHAIKLVYTLTKPVDVTRRRVLELMDYAKKREAKKNWSRQFHVLLGLFKSYKPECVPEDVPAISIHTAFKKLNVALVARFRRIQERNNRLSKQRQHLMWINPLNSLRRQNWSRQFHVLLGLFKSYKPECVPEDVPAISIHTAFKKLNVALVARFRRIQERGRNKKIEPLVPNLEFIHSSRHADDREPPKNYLDFSDPVSLVHYSLQHEMSRPARLRALLCNATGQMLLAVMSHSQQEFLTHDLHHLLNSCFFEMSPYSYVEKQDFLQRLAVLQRTVVQGIPVITRFLAHYLPMWNEKDFFPEILDLSEWVSADCPEYVQCIADCLSRVYLRAQPLEQCAIMRTLTKMYTNMVYASKKSRHHFLNTQPSPTNYSLVLPDLAERIALLCNKGLQVDPGDMRILYSSIWSAKRRALSELNNGASIGALPSPITLALPMIGVSAALIDNMAELMILYKKILSSSKTKDEEYIKILSKYMSDILNCLYSEEALSGRQDGLIFGKLHPQLVAKLGCLMPDVDAKLSIRNHLAFAPYTYLDLVAIDHRDADNKLLFEAVIDQEFPYLGRFLKKALPSLR